MSCNNEELRRSLRFWSRPQHLCDPRSGLGQLGAANIRITNFSRSSGHETTSSNSARAKGLRRLLQHMLEVQSIICRANSHRDLVVRGSLQEENRRQVAPQRERLDAMADGTMVKIDARAAQAILFCVKVSLVT